MQEEKKFLENYADFGSSARLLAVKLFADQYKSISDTNTKQLLDILVMEQFFMMFETFIGFLKAIQDRRKTPILDSLQKDINLQNFFSKLQALKRDDFLRTLDIKLDKMPNISSDEKNRIETGFIKIFDLLNDGDFIEAIELIMKAFPEIKHKFLLYQDDGKVKVVVHEQLAREFEDYKNREPTVFGKLEELPPDIDYMVNLMDRLKGAVQELIAIRLLEIQ